MFDTLRQELRWAIRSLVRTPIFTVTSLVVLTLGIGANAAIFSVVDAVLLRPLPFRNSDRIVRVAREPIRRAFDARGFRLVRTSFPTVRCSKRSGCFRRVASIWAVTFQNAREQPR
jgi:putative ABC transport system permease protein